MTNEEHGLLRHAGYWRWLAGAQLARLPIAMAPLALTSLTTGLTGSYAIGAAMVATIMIAEVASAIPVGRLLDRAGVVLGVRLLLIARGFAYGGLLVALLVGLPTTALIALSALAGALGGGLLGGFRTLLTGVVGTMMLTRAIAINAIVVEGVIVGGPVLVGVLALLSTGSPVLGMAAASFLAALFVPAAAGQLKHHPVPSRGTALLRPLSGWVCCAFALGHLLSTIEVAALPLAARLDGGTATASLLIAALALASVVGGAVWAARGHAGSPAIAALMLCLLAAGATIVAFGFTWPVLLVGLVLAGLCIAPIGTMFSVQAEDIIPPHRRAEGFALLNTAQGLGFGVGALALSALPLRTVQLLGIGSALLAAAVVLLPAKRKPVGPPATVAPGPDKV